MSMKLLSLEDANARLPLLKSIVRSVVNTWDETIIKRSQLAKNELDKIEDDTLKPEINALIDKLNGYIKEVEDIGCYIGEFRRGIVQIPTLFHGRRVLYCVQPLVENGVKYYHDLDESFEDRREIGIFLKYFLLRR